MAGRIATAGAALAALLAVHATGAAACGHDEAPRLTAPDTPAAADDAIPFTGHGNGIAADAGIGGCGCGGTGRGAQLGARRPAADTVLADGHTASAAATEWIEANTVVIPAGKFHMGTDGKAISGDGEGPARWVEIPHPYRMDKTEVSNAQFAEFVRAKGHKTDAEKYGWSFVLEWQATPETNAKATQSVQNAQWWIKVDGATWDRPFGPDSSVDGLQSKPVVHVSYNDAAAYCAWRGGRVPTEAEWERAARGGVEDQLFPWGNDLLVDGQHRCNIWQGRFPSLNTAEDGFRDTAPVETFEPNAYGLYQMIGNVWEWTSSPFAPGSPLHATKGGSFLCHHSYCYRYRNSARTRNEPDSSTTNIGIRCVYDV